MSTYFTNSVKKFHLSIEFEPYEYFQLIFIIIVFEILIATLCINLSNVTLQFHLVMYKYLFHLGSYM